MNLTARKAEPRASISLSIFHWQVRSRWAAIVLNSVRSGAIVAYQQYRELKRLLFQGGFYLAAPVNGYNQICGTSLGGGGEFTYYVMHFSNQEYVVSKTIHVNFNDD
jgi:hypothetical protein